MRIIIEEKNGNRIDRSYINLNTANNEIPLSVADAICKQINLLPETRDIMFARVDRVTNPVTREYGTHPLNR
jgi:hypothetical protein